MKIEYVIVGLVVLGLLSGFFGSWLWEQMRTPQDRMKDFYLTENAVGVSPFDYANSLNSSNPMGTLVDLRNKADYDKQHFVTSLNIPASELTKAQVLAAFQQLPKDKPIIIYCYSSVCMLSIEVGTYLAENNFYAKHLNVGWAELQSGFPNYLVNGTSPGIANVSSNASSGCPATGLGFGC